MFGFGKKKDIYEQIATWQEKGMLGKLMDTAMWHVEEDVRVAAFKALGQLHSNDAIEMLVDTFRQPETEKVKLAAAEALGRIATNKEFDVMMHISDIEENQNVAMALKAAAIEAKDRHKY